MELIWLLIDLGAIMLAGLALTGIVGVILAVLLWDKIVEDDDY